MKGLVTRNTYVQYESPNTSSKNSKKVMAKVKVFVHAHTPTLAKNASANQKPGRPSWFSDRPKNTNLVEDVAILLPVKFWQNPFFNKQFQM